MLLLSAIFCVLGTFFSGECGWVPNVDSFRVRTWRSGNTEDTVIDIHWRASSIKDSCALQTLVCGDEKCVEMIRSGYERRLSNITPWSSISFSVYSSDDLFVGTYGSASTVYPCGFVSKGPVFDGGYYRFKLSGGLRIDSATARYTPMQGASTCYVKDEKPRTGWLAWLRKCFGRTP
jgi:hypothetical protein